MEGQENAKNESVVGFVGLLFYFHSATIAGLKLLRLKGALVSGQQPANKLTCKVTIAESMQAKVLIVHSLDGYLTPTMLVLLIITTAHSS